MKTTMPVTNQFSPAEKIALFLPLFRVLQEISQTIKLTPLPDPTQLLLACFDR